MKKQVLKTLVLKKYTISNVQLSKIRGGSGGEEGGLMGDDDIVDPPPPPPPTNSCATRGCWSMNRICV